MDVAGGEIRARSQAGREDGPGTDAGFSLIETLIALMLLGIVVVGILSLLFTLTIVSAQASRQSKAEQYSIQVAEAIKAAGYDTACDYQTIADGVTKPDELDPATTTTQVQSAGDLGTDAWTSPCTGDEPLHKVTVNATDSDSAEAIQVVVVRKPYV